MSERFLSSKLTADVADFNRSIGQATAVVQRFSKAKEDAAKADGLAMDAQGKWRDAQGQFVSAAERSRRGITNMTEETDKASQSSSKAATAWAQLARSARNNEQAWSSTGRVFTGIGAAAAAGVGAAVVAFARFDGAMSKVQASTGETSTNMDRLREAALKAGADTSFSATEAAAGIEELSKAGVSTADILGGGLDGALSLAAAGSIEVADAAEIASSALSQFKLGGEDVGRVADLLANGANKAQGGVGDLGAALGQSGLVASQFGLDVDEAVGTLTAFANAGLIGSDAGTSFRTMLLALANPSKESKELMDKLGIAAYDAGGNFVGTEALAGQLQDRLGGLTQAQRDQALAQIFGSDAIRAANVLYVEGAEGVAAWRDEVDQAGAAAATAATNMDNLTGDLEGLRGSLETALIGTGESADGPLRMLVQGLDDVVDGYNRLPDGVKEATLTIGASTAAAGLAAGAFFTLGPRVLDVVTGMVELRKSAPGAASGLGNVARAAGVLTALMVAAPAVQRFTELTTDELLKLDDAIGLVADGKVEDFDRQIAALQQNDIPGWLNAVNGSGGFSTVAEGLENLADPTLGNRVNDVLGTLGSFGGNAGRAERDLLVQQLSSMDEGLAALANSGSADLAQAQFEELTSGVDRTRVSQEDLAAAFPAYTEAMGQVAVSTELAAASTQDLGGAVGALPDATGVAAAGVAGLPATFEQLVESMGLAADASDGLRDTFVESGETMLGFAEPLATYTGLLEQKTAADRAQAEETAANTEDQSDSWEDYVTNVGVSVSEYLDEQRRMVEAQTDWQANMLTLAGQVSQGTIDELARMGPEGAPLVAELVNASDAELAEMDDLFAARSADAVFAWGEKIRLAGPVLAQIAADAGEGAADAAAEQLANGTATIEDIARQYGIALAGGLNPVIISAGGKRIDMTSLERRDRAMANRNADGSLTEYPAIGSQQPQIQPNHGDRGIMWAETGAGPAPLFIPGRRLRLELAA